MRYDREIFTNAKIISGNELAQIAEAVSGFEPAHSDFEFPRWIWGVMFAGYATFFAGLLAGTARDGKTAFAIVISILFAVMFFGTASILANIDRRCVGAFSLSGGKLQTCTGPMGLTAVAGQVLAIPVLLGIFGIVIAIIRAVVM